MLARVAGGDAAAMRECLARYGGLVWSLARRYAPSEAEDAVQDIFVDLWKSADRFDPAIASEPAFVAMIARRRLIDRLRRGGARSSVEGVLAADELQEVSDPATLPDRSAEASLATRALGALRPEQRQVLLLATCEGFSHDEISRKTGMPLGTVKAHARRGLLRIRAALLGVQDPEEGAA